MASTELRDPGKTEAGSVCRPSAKLGSVKDKLWGYHTEHGHLRV